MTEILLSTKHDDIAVLTLNRPEALNALNREILEAMRNQLKTIADDVRVRAVILTGAGEKAFCAGADLKERRTMTLDDTRTFVKLISQTFAQIANLPMPTIAAISGVAFGGGLELALACDLRVAHSRAQMGLTECALGIIPGAGGTQRLPRIVGEAKAKELIFSAKRIDSTEAKAIGLVNQVAEGNQSAIDVALMLASQIAKCAPLSVRSAKRAIVGGATLALEKGLELEAKCYEEILNSKDRVEGLQAFADKRTPQFQGQ